MHLLLDESQLAGGAIRGESNGIEVLLPHLLQELQTARFPAAPVSRSARTFLRHFHCTQNGQIIALPRPLLLPRRLGIPSRSLTAFVTRKYACNLVATHVACPSSFFFSSRRIANLCAKHSAANTQRETKAETMINP